MSFRYKSALLSLVSMAAVYGWYFAWVFTHRRADGSMVHMSGTILLLVIVQIVGHIGIALTSSEKQAPMDERERGFDRRATSVGYYILLGCVLIIGGTWRMGASGAAIANAALAMVVIAECARQIMFLALHHRAVA